MITCLLFIAGCGKETPTPVPGSTSQSTSSSTTQAPVPASPAQKQESAAESTAALAKRKATALKALSDVMLDKAKFYSTDNKRELYLRDYKDSDTGPGGNSKVRYNASGFDVVDMNGDGVPEVILDMSSAPNSDFDPGYELLHYRSGKVEGFFFGFREIATLAKNGLFSAGNATNNYIEKMRFLGDTYDISPQYYIESADGSDSSKSIYFYYYDVPLTERSYNAAYKDTPYEQARGYSFSDSSIKKWVTNRPASADPKPAALNADLVARQNYLDRLAANGSLKSPGGEAFGGLDEAAQDDQVYAYYQSWDKELNKIYGLLEKKLPADQMNTLRADEHQWITVRDKNATLAEKQWKGRMPGTSDAAEIDQAKNSRLADVTKNRTFYLIDRYFGDTSQPTTTEIIQKYGLKQ